ncbi:hypothetical protein EV586_10885 [Tumebacillus sp. BK434]|uniref:hypothetical protein n=1 Tax=Tumebacillus sp. BK434 TaxID=2512169 RepID=UPI00104729FC|nr:hypothetical protein [Tumebacillus sp. BK434]TCP52710.1 hypothetical protein EV586_10885 [Tumebacillus sp. BK434]
MSVKRALLVSGAVIAAFFVGMYSESFLAQGESPTSAQETVKPGQNGNQFESVYQAIKQNFQMEGYQEILKDTDSIVLVPDSVAGPQYADGGLYPRQKSMIFKKKSNGTVLLLSISKTDNAVQGKRWTHSSGYEARQYNSPEGDYKDVYAAIFPQTDVYTYSFEGTGYSINLTALAHPMMAEEGVLALNELAQFTDKLNTFLKEKHF